LASVQALLSKRSFDESLFEEIYPNLVKSSEIPVLLTLLKTIVGNYSIHKDHKDKAKDIINKFTTLCFYSWSSLYYFSTDFWKDISDDGIKAILENLKNISNIGYQEDLVLSSIGEKKPKDIVHFFYERLMLSKSKKISQPIPFEFHLIKDSLSKNGQEILPEIVKWFSNHDQLANYYASRLIQNIFPLFDSNLESFLVNLTKKRSKKNLGIVLNILEKYDGQPFLHPVLREIIRVYPLDEKLNANLYHVLSKTGVIIGEYGRCDDLKQKIEETRDWLTDSNAKIKEFACEYHKYLDKLIAREKDEVAKETTFRQREFEIDHK